MKVFNMSISCSFLYRMSKAVFIFMALSLCALMNTKNVYASDPVETALAGRHETLSVEQLEKLAGGKDAFVKKLLELRRNERPMFVGVRAQKLLLQYADDEQVQEAILNDVSSPNLAGLARVVMVHIDRAPTPEARKNLAEAGIERAKRDPDFVPFARTLSESSDAEVSRMARAAFD